MLKLKIAKKRKKKESHQEKEMEIKSLIIGREHGRECDGLFDWTHPKTLAIKSEYEECKV